MMSPLDEEYKFQETFSKKNQTKKKGALNDDKHLNLAGILR